MLRDMVEGDIFHTPDYGGCLGIVVSASYLSMETRMYTDDGEVITSHSSIGVVDENGEAFSKLNCLPLRIKVLT